MKPLNEFLKSFHQLSQMRISLGCQSCRSHEVAFPLGGDTLEHFQNEHLMQCFKNVTNVMY